MARRKPKNSKYKSLFETRVAEYLRNKKVRFDYEKSRITFIQPERKRTYHPDFEINETAVVIEAKGYFTAADRAKMLWVKEQHPELQVVLLFQNSDKPLRKGSGTTYGAWATKNGFDWWDFRKGIPNKWLKKQ